jgi:hypothetical protein
LAAQPQNSVAGGGCRAQSIHGFRNPHAHSTGQAQKLLNENRHTSELSGYYMQYDILKDTILAFVLEK